MGWGVVKRGCAVCVWEGGKGRKVKGEAEGGGGERQAERTGGRGEAAAPRSGLEK